MNALNKLLLAGICLFALGCYYDSQEALYNNVNKPTCTDTANVTYSATIAPIIKENCSSCHDITTGPIISGGVVLDNYPGLKQWAGKLVGDLNGSQGFNQMPQTGNKLSNCDIAKIQHWVEMNTPEN